MNRRRFIKALGIGAAGVASALPAVAAQVPAMNSAVASLHNYMVWDNSLKAYLLWTENPDAMWMIRADEIPSDYPSA